MPNQPPPESACGVKTCHPTPEDDLGRTSRSTQRVRKQTIEDITRGTGVPALGIALLAYPDSFLTARSLSSTGGYQVDANQEFLAIGASNAASGLLQGFPVNGSWSRSFVRRDAGGKTNLALLRLVRPHTAELGLVDGTDTVRDVDRNEDAHRIPGLLIHRIDDQPFFANAAFVVRDTKQRLYESDPPAGALVIDAEGVSDIDATAIQQLDEFLDDLEHAEVVVSMARVRPPVWDMLERSGLIDRIGDGAIFLEVDDAVEHYLASGDDAPSGGDA